MYDMVGTGTMVLYIIIAVASLILGVLAILMPIFVLQIKNRANSINDNVKKIVMLLEQDIGKDF